MTIRRALAIVGINIWELVMNDGLKICLLASSAQDARTQGNRVGDMMQPKRHVISCYHRPDTAKPQ